jgi:phytoene dehydrogenase-like protein
MPIPSLHETLNHSSKTGHRPTVIIIGAGVAGMATGIYLQQNGFDTRIYEKHVLPGGCCTAWSRKGYLFDYCIDWLIGSGPGNDANLVWRELGALDGKKINNFDLFNRVIDEAGREVSFYNDPDRLEAHLLSISEIDAIPIKTFCNDLRKFTTLNIFPPLKPKSLMTVGERIKTIAQILPAFRLFWRTGATQMKDFTKSIKDPVLRRAMHYIFFQDPEVFPMLPYLYNMACAYNHNAGFPEGGSLGLSRSIEQRYLSVGGTINYRSTTTRIIVENDRARGIELKKGPPQYADFVISASDASATIFDFLGGHYVNPAITKLYKDVIHRPGILFPSVISVFFGLKGEVGQDDSHSTSYLLDPTQAAMLPGCEQKCIVVQHRSRYSDGFAPPGHSVIHCTYFSDFDYWQNLRNTDKASYREKKRAIAEFLSQFLEQRYPKIREKIEVVEVATPATTKRYTGNLKGSIFGFKAFTEAEDIAERLVNKHRMQLPGLKGFYMTGQWVLGGGLPRAAMSGRYVAQFLCEELKRPFNVSESLSSQIWDNSQLGHLPELDPELG